MLDHSLFLTRRQAIRRTGRGLASLWAASCLADTGFAAEPTLSASPLKQRVKTRTFDVHAHVLGSVAGFTDAAAEEPRDPAAPVTEAELTEALAYLRRGLLTFDSPEQERDMAERQVRGKRIGRTGSLTDNAALLLGQMDDAGIDTAAVLLLDFAAPLLRSGPVSPDTARTWKMIEVFADVCEQHPGRFVPFIAIDVRRGPDGTSLLERAVLEHGYKGAGEIVSTLWQTKPNDKERCYPYYEMCRRLGIPVVIDCTMAYGFSDPPLFEDILRDFPDLPICLGGAGIRVNPVERDGKLQPAHERFLALAAEHENLWLDLDDWQVVDRQGMRAFLGFLRQALDSPARGRVMFGSDFPVFAWMYTERQWIDFILQQVDAEDIRFSDEDLAAFFSTNALKFLKLDAKA